MKARVSLDHRNPMGRIYIMIQRVWEHSPEHFDITSRSIVSCASSVVFWHSVPPEVELRAVSQLEDVMGLLSSGVLARRPFQQLDSATVCPIFDIWWHRLPELGLCMPSSVIGKWSHESRLRQKHVGSRYLICFRFTFIGRLVLQSFSFTFIGRLALQSFIKSACRDKFLQSTWFQDCDLLTIGTFYFWYWHVKRRGGYWYLSFSAHRLPIDCLLRHVACDHIKPIEYLRYYR